MIIEITKLSPEGQPFQGEEPASILELGENGSFRPQGPIAYDLNAQVVSHELVVSGTIAAKGEIQCARCADFFSTTLTDSSFLRAYPVPEGTETVDVTPDIREDILLLLPPFPLCRTACKGLCPQCGKNWNQGPCSCKPEPGGSGGWSALDQLKLDDRGQAADK